MPRPRPPSAAPTPACRPSAAPTRSGGACRSSPWPRTWRRCRPGGSPPGTWKATESPRASIPGPRAGLLQGA
eukprot:10613423-Alexandrium_andersonii.AAC.1